LKVKKYFLSKFIYILPIEESFFFKVKFQKKVKLTDELVNLNYKKNAPYKNPFFIKLMENQDLYIWFYEQSNNSKLIIPESYLLTEYYKERNPNALLRIETQNSYLIIIIKDSLLVNTYSLMEKDDNLIEIEMHKYTLSSWQDIKQDEYFKIKDKILKNLNFKDFYRWVEISADNSKILPQIVNNFAYPLSFLLFFMMSIEIYHSSKVESKLLITEESYMEAKNKNNEIREKINRENLKEKKWIDFVHRELPYANSLSIFMDISKAFEGQAFTFRGFSVVGSKLKLDIETKEDFIVALKLLNKVKDLKQVELQYSNRKRNVASYEVIIVAKGLAL